MAERGDPEGNYFDENFEAVTGKLLINIVSYNHVAQHGGDPKNKLGGELNDSGSGECKMWIS